MKARPIELIRIAIEKLVNEDCLSEALVVLGAIKIANESDLNEIESFGESQIEIEQFSCHYVIYNNIANLQLDEARLLHHTRKLAGLAIKLGLFELGVNISENLESSSFHHSFTNEDRWQDHLKHARALRGIGRSYEALIKYGSLLKENAGDRISEAYLLLMMGKTYHNHYWRLGLYEHFVKCAINRLSTEIHDTTLRNNFNTLNPEKYLGIALDSRAYLVFERFHALQKKSPNPQLLRKLTYWWKRAEHFTSLRGTANSHTRIDCRRNYASYYLAKSKSKKLKAFDLFEGALRELESSPAEKRGTAVRYGQSADMLFDLGNIEKAEYRLYKAIRQSEWLSDWRTFARNQIRLARIWRKTLSNPDNILELLHGAERAMSKTGNTQPELMVDIQIERFHLFSRLGNYSDARNVLIFSRNQLRSLENELDIDQPSDEPPGGSASKVLIDLMPVLQMTLSRTERKGIKQAASDDFRLLVSLQREVLSRIDQQTNLAIVHSTRRAQLQFWEDMAIGQGHHLKSSIKCVASSLNDNLTALQNISSDKHCNSKVQQIKVSTEQDMSRLIDEAQRISRDLSSKEVRFTSVRSVILKVVDLPIIQFDSKDIIIRVLTPEGASRDDFELRCVPAVLEMVFTSLIQNAIHAITSSSNALNGEVNVEVGWFESTTAPFDFGLICIQDNAEKYASLVQAWNNPNPEGTGIRQIKLFFDKYNTEMKPSETRNGMTEINIQIRRSETVRNKHP